MVNPCRPITRAPGCTSLLVGNATLNFSPYVYAEASALGRKHCYGDVASQMKFGHVWYFRLDIPVISVYKDIFQGRDIKIEVWGKHQGGGGGAGFCSLWLESTTRFQPLIV